MNGSALNVLGHLLVLTVLFTGVIIIGYIMYNEAFNKEFNDWNKDKHK